MLWFSRLDIAQDWQGEFMLLASLSVLLVAPLCPASAQDWVGMTIMPVMDAEFRNDSTVVPWSSLTLPLKVEKEMGDCLWIGGAWIKKNQVVPIVEALAYYTLYLDNHPTSHNAYNNRGLVRRYLGDLDDAIRDYTEAILIDADFPLAHNNRGTAWHAKGELEKAVYDYNEAIRLDREFTLAYRNRGSVLRDKGDFDPAIHDFVYALYLNPEFAGAMNGLAWLLATCHDERFRDGQRAVELATKACEITEHKDHLMLDTLAVAYAETGNFESAIKWLKTAIQICPEDQVANLGYSDRLELFNWHQPYRAKASD